jgi:hypothetical protein
MNEKFNLVARMSEAISGFVSPACRYAHAGYEGVAFNELPNRRFCGRTFDFFGTFLDGEV